MEASGHTCAKLIIISVLFLTSICSYISIRTDHYAWKKVLKSIYQSLNDSQIFQSINPILIALIPNHTIINDRQINTTNQTTRSTPPLLTTSTSRPTTIDPAELLVERSPPASRSDQNNPTSTIVAFLFQTNYHVLANLQLYLIRKFATNLVAIELFTDGETSQEMKDAANVHNAILNSFPARNHSPNAGPSDRNTNVVNWAIATKAKGYLRNGASILLLDGDVLPLSPFDAGTLLNGHDVICRKHPALFARFCWIGLICIGPGIYDTVGDFSVSQDMRSGKSYDSGGKTAEYFLKYENVSFAWMRETILIDQDKSIFWGAMDGDIQWIAQHFSRCDKCGPEIFFSPFNASNAVFYHMISATSDWRFGGQGPRQQAIHDAVMRSPFGPNQQYSSSEMTSSIRKIQQMPLIPFKGNLTCEQICQG